MLSVSLCIGQAAPYETSYPVVPSELSVLTTAGNTLEVIVDAAMFSISVTEPLALAGIYQVDPQALASGPVNLVAPHIAGTPQVGQVLTAHAGLWAYDADVGIPNVSLTWILDDVALHGDATHTVGPSGTVLHVRETLTQDGGHITQAESTHLIL